MKRNSKRLAALILTGIMVAGLSACGQSDAPAADAASTPAAEGTSAPAEDASAPAEDTSAPAEDSSASTDEIVTNDEGVWITEGAEGKKIGATFYTLQTEFCMRMDNAAKKWAEANGVEYTSYDGNNDAAEQLRQVETMIAQGVDAIILNPQDADACSACVDIAVEAGIPIIGVNTMVNNENLTSYVGSQDVGAGEEIMQYMIDYLGSTDFNIVVIEGPMGQSAQLQRWEGINNVLAQNPDIDILEYNTANWRRDEAQTLMETWINAHGDEIDAVIGENDEMALGARLAIEEAGLDIPCIGIDGITDAVSAVAEGRMIASDFQDAEGQIQGALDNAVKASNGENVEKERWIPFQMITPDNYQDYVGRY